MNEVKTDRSYQERFLDGFDRSRIRREVSRSRWNGLDHLRKRYATILLGASLAVGGLGIPMKSSGMFDLAQKGKAGRSSSNGLLKELTSDLKAAQMIAREVSGGVTSAASTFTDPLQIGIGERELTIVSDKVKEDFFRSEVPFGSLIYKEAKKNNLSPELVAAVVQTESRFIPNARSQAGAQGLMQLVPRTGKWMGARNLMNPAENVAAGAKYLKYLEKRFDGDRRKIIAAYNAGEGNVRRCTPR